MTKVFIADDHMLIREGLKKILKPEPDITIVGETADPLTIQTFLENNEVDILILDINMPGKNGLDVLKDIKITNPDVKVLILSMSPEEHYAKRAYKAGASGYISKDSVSEELVLAIRKVAVGRKYVSPTFAELLAADVDPGSKKSENGLLSDREFQVLVLLAKGKSQIDIGEELALSPSTVNTYRSRILEKLNLKSNAEMIYYAVQNKIID